MPTHKIKATVAIIVTLLFFQTTNAQLDSLLGWKETTISGNKGASYNRSTNSREDHALYSNTNYDWNKISKEYPPNEYLDQTFPGYKTDIHNSFLRAVKTCLSEERIKALANRNEQFHLGLNLDQNGNILYMYFSLDTNTVITPDELYCLEVNFKKLLVFVPIRKINEKHMDGFGITTTFKEIQAGEIPAIRREEERQKKKEQWEARQHRN